ncbi:MAG TPA: LamG domain-containing protein, partial [Hydrogenothermaceae bacterium]|nr:LamG domain-containing protein [Hydrogenothermaceae bacterium]
KITKDTFVRIPHSESLNISGSFTVECWISFGPRLTNTWQYIIGKFDSNVDNDGATKSTFALRDLNGAITFGLWNEEGRYFFFSYPHNWYGDGFFHHIAVTYDADVPEVRMYLDGEEVLSTKIDVRVGGKRMKLQTNEFPVYIGRNTKNLNGLIGEVRIYNRALAPEEIKKHFEEKKNSFGEFDPEVFREWSIWEGTFMPWCYNMGTHKLNVAWQWGLARFFRHGCEVDYEISAITSEFDFNDEFNSAWILPKGDIGLYGAEITWPTELEKGYIYRFKIAVAPPPSYILVNDKKVWDVKDGHYKNSFVQFDYVPSGNEKIKIYLVKENDPSGMKFCRIGARMDGKISNVYFLCLRAPYEGSIPAYEKRVLPQETIFLGMDPHLVKSHLPEYGKKPVKYKKPPLKKPSYPTDEIVILNHSALIKGHIKNNGINGIFLHVFHHGYSSEVIKKNTASLQE